VIIDWSVSVDSSICGRISTRLFWPTRPTPRARSAPACEPAGSAALIPEPDDQKAHRNRRGSRGGRPVTYDHNAYRGRHVIERAFNGFKRWRGFATRYDKHASVYRGALVLAAALLWINDLSGVVASVLGVEHAFGELRRALVRRCDELHENGGALDDVRAGLAEEGEELLKESTHSFPVSM
jgi:transposase